MTTLLAQLFSLEKDFQVDTARQEQGLSLLLNNNDKTSCVLVAESNHKAIAMCSIQVLISTAMGGEVGLLEDLIVDADHRYTGIGKALLVEAEGWCQQRGLLRLQLLADRDNNKALDFYARYGWLSTNLRALSRFMS